MKLQKTFTIDEKISKLFDELAKKNSINKSLFVENSMLEYIQYEKLNIDKKISYDNE